MKMNRTNTASRLLALLLAALMALSLAACGSKRADDKTDGTETANRRMPRKRLPCTRI